MSFTTAPVVSIGTAVEPDNATVFVSLELSRSKWLITALSPCSDKMSKYSVDSGDGTALLHRLTYLGSKAERRFGIAIKIVVIQEGAIAEFW